MRSACGSIAIVVCGLVPVLGAGQEPTREANLAFEVASVKANPSGTVVLPDGRVATGTDIGSAGGRFSAQNASLHTYDSALRRCRHANTEPAHRTATSPARGVIQIEAYRPGVFCARSKRDVSM